MGFSLRVNQKKRAVSSVGPVVRDEQFKYISEKRQEFLKRGAMVISVDTKKKELIGLFENAGRAWPRQAVAVNDHDFRSQAEGVAIPYGVYDMVANHGAVYVGVSFGLFAV